MSCSVLVTFDIKKGTSKDYDCLYEQLDKQGLKRNLLFDDGRRISISTTTTVAGQFEGADSVSLAH